MKNNNATEYLTEALERAAEWAYEGAGACPLGYMDTPRESCEECSMGDSLAIKCWMRYFQEEPKNGI